MAFLNAKDVAYDRPGSVAGYYGWSPGSIDNVIDSALGGPSKNAANIRQSLDKYLGKRGTSLDAASPQQRIAAMDYAYREEGRKQQTKGGGFLDFLKKAIGPAVGALVLPGVGAALGTTISAGVGGAIGGAIQGGVEDGPLGALTGAASGYGIGSGVGAAKNWASNALSPSAGFSYGGDVVGAASKLGALPSGLDAAAMSQVPGVGIAGQVIAGMGGNSLLARAGSTANALSGVAGLLGGQQIEGPGAAPNESPGVSLGGSAEAPRPSIGGSPAQTPTFDATLLSAAGKMPNNALAMTGMGAGGVGLTERDLRRNPGYQPRPVANFLMV